MNGRVSGNGAGVALSTLTRRAVLPNRRLPHVVTAIGDSRVAALYIDILGSSRTRGAGSALNWANALLGHRMVIGETFGVSGDRTDQMLTRIDAAIATGAGTLYMLMGVNNLGQSTAGYVHAVSGTVVNAANVAAITFADIKAMADKALAAGMTVVLEIEPGGNILNTAALVGSWNDLNARIYEYGESTPGLHLHDARPVILQPGYSDTALQIRSGYAYDGLHMAGLGGYRWGKSLAALLDRLIPARGGILIQNRAELVGNGRRQLAANPIFATATGGSLAGGATGTVPAGWTGRRQNASDTVVFGTRADPGGIGNNVTIDCTFTAAGVGNSNYARLLQDINPASWQAGDVVEAVARVQVIGNPTALRGVRLLSQCSTTPTGNQDSMDLLAADGWLGPDEAHELVLKTRPYTIPAFTAQAYLNVQLSVDAAGAGLVSIMVKELGIRRRQNS